MTASSEWKRAIAELIGGGTHEGSALRSALSARFPDAKPPTVSEKISRFAERDRSLSGVHYRLRAGARPSGRTAFRHPADTGIGWYERFVGYGLGVDHAGLFYSTEGDRAWTTLVLGMCKEIGEDAGYTVKGKPELNRWDQTWLGHGKPSVVIEHENSPDTSGLDSELNHLVPAEAALKVLITYYPASSLIEATDSLLRDIKERLTTQGISRSEFLLMTARWEIDDVRDFRAFVVRPFWTEHRL